MSETHLAAFVKKIAQLDIDTQHYWIGILYTLLLPSSVRRSRAAYFTPPHLARALLSLVQAEGFDLLQHTAVDPAAGGAAFLSTLAGEMAKRGSSPESILGRLHGIEIDPGLATLSEVLIGRRIGTDVKKSSLVTPGDSLRRKFSDTYDLVIANPPYGRVAQADLDDEGWRTVCHPGHINKYALFAELCFRLAKPRGLVALILPSSFMTGPLYGRLRAFIRQKGEVLALGSVTSRQDVFVDVAQDVSILLARAGTPHAATRAVTFGDFVGIGPFKAHSASALPGDTDKPWILAGPRKGLPAGGATLADYGAVLRSGYFVWNRELERMSKRCHGKLWMPLVWAKNVGRQGFCVPQAKKGSGIDFVRFVSDSPAIVRTNAIVMQRTTNSMQERRLVAARVSPSVAKKWGGFVSENHTIVITAPTVRELNLLCFLLNSSAVDARYRQLSGTASVSVTLLRGLDLPTPEALSKAVASLGTCEAAVEQAYAESLPASAAVSA